MQTITEAASQSLQSQLAFMAKQIEALTALTQQTVAKPSRKGDSITLDEYFPIWEATKSHDIQKTTLDKNRHTYKRISAVFGAKKLSDIQRADVQNFVNDMAEKRLSMDYIKHIKGMLNSMFELALADDYIAKNPCKAIKLPKVETKKKRPATKEEYEAMVKVSKDHRLGFTIPLLFETGIRRGELLALTWDDVDFQKKRIHVTKQYIESCGQGKAVLKHHTKTKAGMRYVPLSSNLVKLLKEERKKSKGFRFVVRKQEEDAMVNPSVYRKVFTTWRYKANVGEDVTPHSARHYFGTNMHKSGIPTTMLSQVMGHADGTTTMDIYCHDSNEFDASDRKKIEEGLRGLGLRNE